MLCDERQDNQGSVGFPKTAATTPCEGAALLYYEYKYVACCQPCGFGGFCRPGREKEAAWNLSKNHRGRGPKACLDVTAPTVRCTMTPQRSLTWC